MTLLHASPQRLRFWSRVLWHLTTCMTTRLEYPFKKISSTLKRWASTKRNVPAIELTHWYVLITTCIRVRSGCHVRVRRDRLMSKVVSHRRRVVMNHMPSRAHCADCADRSNRACLTTSALDLTAQHQSPDSNAEVDQWHQQHETVQSPECLNHLQTQHYTTLVMRSVILYLQSG